MNFLEYNQQTIDRYNILRNERITFLSSFISFYLGSTMFIFFKLKVLIKNNI